MRASLKVLAVVAVTFVASGCSQATTPTSPSAAAAGSASASTSERITAQGGKSTEDTATVLLVCDSAVNAQADVRLVDDILTQNVLGTAHLECGPDSFSGSRRDTVKLVTSQQAGWAIIDTFTVQTGAFNGGCPGATVVPGQLECPGSSKKSPAASATLTFR
jgi:hypothetical protein